MSNKISIDFTMAKIISDEINEQIDEAEKNYQKSKSCNQNLSGLPSRFFANTNKEIEAFANNLSIFKEKLSSISFAFDSSVQNYYSAEENSEEETKTVLPEITRGSTNQKFTWGYKQANSSITKVNSEYLSNLLSSKGAKKINDNTYQININGKNYQYNVETGWVTDPNKRKFKCNFYTTSNTLTSLDIKNTITLLATGKGNCIADDMVKPNLALNDNSLLIVPFTNTKENMATTNVAASTYLGDYIFSVPKGATRSIAGFSAGSAAATRTVSAYPGLYQNVVYVNGASHNAKGTSIIGLNKYGAFKDTNVIYLETTGGWCPSDSNKQPGVISSVNTMLSNGVKKENITVITNDTDLARSLSKVIDVDTSMTPVTVNGKNTSFRGHGTGAYAIFNDSGIMSYLSSL